MAHWCSWDIQHGFIQGQDFEQKLLDESPRHLLAASVHDFLQKVIVLAMFSQKAIKQERIRRDNFLSSEKSALSLYLGSTL
jgi:hypothetical protein